MKATGIVRKVDDLGRIVLPVELRRSLGIEVRDPIEIYVVDDAIMLRKHNPACIFCGNSKNIIAYRGKSICADCAHSFAGEFPAL